MHMHANTCACTISHFLEVFMKAPRVCSLLSSKRSSALHARMINGELSAMNLCSRSFH